MIMTFKLDTRPRQQSSVPCMEWLFCDMFKPLSDKKIENILVGIANPHRFSKYLTPISPKYDQWGIRVIRYW